MEDDLESILNTEKSDTPAPPPASTTEQPRDEQGRFSTASTGETPEESAPPAQEQEQGHIPVAALKDERQKRQAEAEARQKTEEQLRQYEAYFQSLQQPQQQPQAPDPNVDFAGWLNWRDQQIYAQIRESIMGEVQQAGNQFSTMTRAQVSEMQARQRHEDYDQVIEASFKEAVEANPNLVTLLAQDPDPAAFAYRTGKSWEQAKALGKTEPVSREAIEAEIRQQIMAELNLSQPPKAPTSLASTRSVGTRSGPAWTGPTPLEDIL